MAALHLIVTGRVQGVGFRWFVQRQAAALNLTGWVKNRGDGTVEIWAEGSPEARKALEEAVRRGPSGSRVTKVNAREATATGRYFQFDITF
ncbi:MAG: acylphosphatase [Spirochaetales bacterium]|nr:acylphosphatase [Spirochaetales bacterium]